MSLRIDKSPIIERIGLNFPFYEVYGRFSRVKDTAFLSSSLKTDAGRYSYIGLDPFLVLKGKDGAAFDRLERIFQCYRIKGAGKFPFAAGGIGYLSYDLKNLLENLPNRSKDDLKLPNIYFVFYRALLIHDNTKPNEIYISVLDFAGKGHKPASELIRKIKTVVKNGPEKRDKALKGLAKASFKSNFSKEKYVNAVGKVIEYIRAGDIFQACLSQRFHSIWDGPPYKLYKRLNQINPAPFSAYLNFKPCKIISSSPELFLKVDKDSIETRPMKGTRSRGGTKAQDKKFNRELIISEKDRAELAMIVDLERNDLGKVSRPGSVKVSEPRRIETYPSVFQAISVIKSKRDNRATLVDILKACFPGGSITGCPKIRAMEIIDELEPTARGIYTGAIGYISFHDTMELNIAIRTIVLKNKDAFFSAGGGIVADSNPEAEYKETLDKARAMMRSL